MKDYRRVALSVFALSLTCLVLLAGVSSTSSAAREYDPLVDVTDDGKINILDLAKVATLFGTEGQPINKTLLMIEIPKRMNHAENNITIALQLILDLQNEVALLKNQTVYVPVFRKPDYDSNWLDLNISRRRVLTHNLSTTNVFVYMVGKYSDSETPYIHQRDYGGEAHIALYYGAYWYDLTETTVAVERRADDDNWNYVRVMIWKIPT